MTEHGSVRFGGTTIDYRVRRSNRRRKTVHITVDGTGVRVAAPQDTPEDDVRAIVRRRAPWILAHAPGALLESPAQAFRHSVVRWWPRFGGRTQFQVLIRDQRQRWGSCAPDGTLRFNWRVAMLRPDLAEYVVVHELAHLKVRHHSPEFWGLLSRTMPDAQHRRHRLREVGRSLPM